MAAQIPVKAIYSGSDVTSLGEYASGDTIADGYIAALTASKLTGALPAISGAALTNLPADATKLPLAGGAMTGNITFSGSQTVDGVDISARDAILTSTTTTATAALPKAGGTMTGAITTLSITETETTKTASFTPNLSTDGTIFDVSGAITITMPSATAGKSFTIIDAGTGTLSWGGTIKWAGGSAPSPSGITIYSFISNGTNWYGMMAGTGFA
jgi:hypothetical protein